ncbi:hypothetical protein BSM4216_0505 [Bacillus smithii]|nr:hypothetical protein BSM4216_0505 [Bacillus smithii]
MLSEEVRLFVFGKNIGNVLIIHTKKVYFHHIGRRLQKLSLYSDSGIIK